MKRFLCLVLCFAFVVCLAGCGDEVKQRNFDFDLKISQNLISYAVVQGDISSYTFGGDNYWIMPITIYALPKRSYIIDYIDCVAYLEPYVLDDRIHDVVTWDTDVEIEVVFDHKGYGIGSATLFCRGNSLPVNQLGVRVLRSSGTTVYVYQ